MRDIHRSIPFHPVHALVDRRKLTANFVPVLSQVYRQVVHSSPQCAPVAIDRLRFDEGECLLDQSEHQRCNEDASRDRNGDDALKLVIEVQ